jgi:hypothetical protein
MVSKFNSPLPQEDSSQKSWKWKLHLDSLFALFSSQGARQGYLAAVDQGVISVSNFLATIILARSVSPTELGVYGAGFIALRLVRSVQEGITVQPMNVFGASMTYQPDPDLPGPAFGRNGSGLRVGLDRHRQRCSRTDFILPVVCLPLVAVARIPEAYALHPPGSP